MIERLMDGPGYAIVAQFGYSEGAGRLEAVGQFALDPGQGLIFVGDGEIPQPPIPFEQREIQDVMSRIPREQVGMIALLEHRTGGLLFTNGTPDGTRGVGRTTPNNVMQARLGRTVIAGIWGPSRGEAELTLRGLSQMRLSQN